MFPPDFAILTSESDSPHQNPLQKFYGIHWDNSFMDCSWLLSVIDLYETLYNSLPNGGCEFRLDDIWIFSRKMFVFPHFMIENFLLEVVLFTVSVFTTTRGRNCSEIQHDNFIYKVGVFHECQLRLNGWVSENASYVFRNVLDCIRVKSCHGSGKEESATSNYNDI